MWVDERPVAAQALTHMAVPPLWTGIDQTRDLDGGLLPYEADASAASGLRFVLDVGPGVHRVRVRYRVQAGSFDDGAHANRTWQVAYSLAPARLWAGFGQLDVTVLAPADWELASTLPLRTAADPDGVRAVGRFAGVPGDVLALSVRAPEPAGRRPLHALAFLAALVVAAVFGALGGVAVGRSGTHAAVGAAGVAARRRRGGGGAHRAAQRRRRPGRLAGARLRRDARQPVHARAARAAARHGRGAGHRRPRRAARPASRRPPPGADVRN